jgi:hypothetical protein
MKPGTTRTVNAILRFEPEEDVELPLVSDDPDIAAPTTGSVVIPAGMYTASFEVMAGETEGETTLHVGSGNLMEHLEVSVSENPGGGPGQKVYWQPKRVNMDFESLRWVVLRLKESAEEAVDIALVQIEGGDGVVVFPSNVSVPAGELIVPVGLASGTLPGKVKIQAILPESQGGDTDEITVEIRDKEASKRRLEWEPDEIETGPNQTVSATLMLSEPAPYDLKVILSSRPKDVLLVSFPSEVTIPEGEAEVQVEFEIGGKAGKVQIRAGLPFRKGGGNAKLKIEVED